MFGRKKKHAAEDALEKQARLRNDFLDRAGRIVAECARDALKRYRELPAAGWINTCPKCDSTRLSRTFDNATAAAHQPLCQCLRGESQLYGVNWVGHVDVVLETLIVSCECGYVIGVERPADAHRNATNDEGNDGE